MKKLKQKSIFTNFVPVEGITKHKKAINTAPQINSSNYIDNSLTNAISTIMDSSPIQVVEPSKVLNSEIVKPSKLSWVAPVLCVVGLAASAVLAVGIYKYKMSQREEEMSNADGVNEPIDNRSPEEIKKQQLADWYILRYQYENSPMTLDKAVNYDETIEWIDSHKPKNI